MFHVWVQPEANTSCMMGVKSSHLPQPDWWLILYFHVNRHFEQNTSDFLSISERMFALCHIICKWKRVLQEKDGVRGFEMNEWMNEGHNPHRWKYARLWRPSGAGYVLLQPTAVSVWTIAPSCLHIFFSPAWIYSTISCFLCKCLATSVSVQG